MIYSEPNWWQNRYKQSVVVAAATFSTALERLALAKYRDTKEEALKDAELMDSIYNAIPSYQRSCAAQALQSWRY